MSDVKISALPLLSCVDVCNSIIPIVQCGVTYQTLSCNVGGGSGTVFGPDPNESTGIVAIQKGNCAAGFYSFVNGCNNIVCNTFQNVQVGPVNTWSTFCAVPGLTSLCAIGDYTSCIPLSNANIIYYDTTTSCSISAYDPGVSFDGTSTSLQLYGVTTSFTLGTVGCLNLLSGEGSTASTIVGGSGNIVKGTCSFAMGTGNKIDGTGSIATGLGNVAGTSSTSITGGARFSSSSKYINADFTCSAYPNFINGVAILPTCLGDQSAYLPAGSTFSLACVYKEPGATSLASNIAVSSSCYVAGCGTIINTGDPTFTFSGYMYKTGPFSTSSYSYYPSQILGGRNNTLSCYGISGGTIVGGYFNTVSGYLGYIGAGSFNRIYDTVYNGIIIGGNKNCVTNDESFIGTGYNNCISGYRSTIVNGSNLRIQSNNSFIGAGSQGADATICINSDYAFIGIASVSKINCNSPYTFIGTGLCNIINTVSPYASILGGRINTICANSTHGTILSGYRNTVSAAYGVVLGGLCNTTTNTYGTVLSGYCNTVSSSYGVVLGGNFNNVCNSYSFVAGSNITTDRTYTMFVNNLSIKSIPTSVTGLPSGSVWSDGGTLKIV